jgi:hypothetical protein
MGERRYVVLLAVGGGPPHQRPPPSRTGEAALSGRASAPSRTPHPAPHPRWSRLVRAWQSPGEQRPVAKCHRDGSHQRDGADLQRAAGDADRDRVVRGHGPGDPDGLAARARRVGHLRGYPAGSGDSPAAPTVASAGDGIMDRANRSNDRIARVVFFVSVPPALPVTSRPDRDRTREPPADLRTRSTGGTASEGRVKEGPPGGAR